MKLVHKIILANSLGIIAIILVAGFSYHEFDLLLAKLRFVEIADTLNASFLTMRLSEKNYFLYKDAEAVPLIEKQIQEEYLTIERMRPSIVKAIGDEKYKRLQLELGRYEKAISGIRKIDESGKDRDKIERDIREAGRALRLFSASMVRAERREANNIISASKRTLLSFFGLVILVAIMSNYFFFSRMFKNLRRIERTANSISEGNFIKIQGKIPENELGSAMKAINAMCEELKTGHEQLIQSRKLASLGTLTAGVAHELGNPLNNISMVAQTYLELFEHLSNEDKVDYVRTVLEESERIRKIVQDLLDFSRTKERNFRVSDMNDVVRRSLRLVQNMLDVSGIETALTLQENLPPVFIDEDKIREVLVNLVTNAIHAMSSGDTIFLRTNLADDENHILISIKDTGKGIPPELLGHIFDPFFSTKGTEGTGLGLSISYGIIKKHKGKIDVKSTVGQGTTFTIELPIYEIKEGENEWPQNHGN
jgi:two-component system NtrC family sensor kinase